MKLYPTCGKLVPIHTSADKRNMNEEKQECQESVCPGPTYPATLHFFFSCVCLMLHRIFTLRTETRWPHCQPPGLPWKRGCNCKHGQTLLLPITESRVPWLSRADGEQLLYVSHQPGSGSPRTTHLSAAGSQKTSLLPTVPRLDHTKLGTSFIELRTIQDRVTQPRCVFSAMSFFS